MKKRGSGILLHITSLPSAFGIGDLGPEAFRFVDFLAETKQSFWQILPLNPTELIHGSSPYHSISAFAHNHLLISPELLIQDGLLDNKNLQFLPNYPKAKVDYQAVSADRGKILNLAYQRFKKKRQGKHEYEKFCSDNSYWLKDYALFVALKDHFSGKIWNQWPADIRDKKCEVIKSLNKQHQDKIEMEKFIQYVFIKQWLSLKHYSNQKGIKIIGDMPIYVELNSAEAWVNPDIFKLDSQKKPYVVAGVPPDYFSKTGQLWGNPLYRWDKLKERGYDWWIQRIRHNLKLVDILRIDHFRGLVAYWEVLASEKTAIKGSWVEAPAVDLFNKLTERFPNLPLIAEDLGIITPDVREVMQRFGLPGMKVLLFAFGEDNPAHPYLPHTYNNNCVVYTGTHDNNTARGWFDKEAKPEDKKRLFEYLGRKVKTKEAAWELIHLAMKSAANIAIFPMQDILGLGQVARMNKPATKKGNWQWRLLSKQLSLSLTKKLSKITEDCARA
ncbi:MAG: 4-alpha-glucanotransferase [Candidatus Omnitrophota bacterium]|jgi:4-alpha-glucanotransferase